MPTTAERLLGLLSLLQSPREWSGGELAERLGVSRRTVRRDVDRLRSLGYPVEATLGTAGGYHLTAGAALPPLLLDDEEAVAVAVGLRVAAGQALAGVEESAVRALTKLEQVLPGRLRQRVRALSEATLPATWAGDAGSPVDPEHLATLAAAVVGELRVRFRYVATDGTTTERRVEPHRLVAMGRRWYLVAFDVDRDDWRTFRVDRLTDVQPAGGRGKVRALPAPDAAAFLRDSTFGLAPVHQAVVTLHARADEVRAQLGDTAGELTPLRGRRCRLVTHADTVPWLAFRLSSIGCDFDVHEPPELVEHLQTLADRYTKAAGGATPPRSRRAATTGRR